MKKTLQLLFALFLTMTVAACGGTGGGSYSGMGPFPANTGVVTKDPNSIPNIAWQTDSQRDILMAQNSTFAREQTMSERDPNRPALQTIVGENPAAARKVTVAILLPLTGKNADLGQSMLKAAQMALFDVGSSNFQLVPKDTKSTPDGAALAARSATAENVDMILGPIFADDVKAVKSIAKAPVIAFTTDWKLAGNNTYIMGFLPHAQVARVAAYAESRGHKRFAVYAPQTEYCDMVIATLQRTGVSIAKVERYSPMQSDLSDLVKDFADRSRGGQPKGAPLDFDTLMMPVGGESLRSLASVFDLHGVRSSSVRFIGTGLWDDASLTNDPALYGGWFAAPDPQLRRDFERRYQENYGAVAPRLSSLAYDSTALAAVLARTGGDDAYSRAQLTNPRGFAGIDGVFRFRNDGLAERGLAVLEIQSGRARIIDPAPTAFISSGS